MAEIYVKHLKKKLS
jgi:ankyrin repeat protein